MRAICRTGAVAALAVALLTGSPLAASAATDQNAPAGVEAQQIGPLSDIMQGLIQAGITDQRAALEALFAPLAGDPEAIAALAINLLDTLEGDPTQIADAADVIVAVAEDALFALPTDQVFSFDVADGAYGMVLLIGNTGDATETQETMSTSVFISGGDARIVGLSAEDLGSHGEIFQPEGLPLPAFISVDGLDSGGLDLLTAEVVGGRFTIEMRSDDVGTTFIKGVLLVSSDGGSVLSVAYQPPSPEDVFLAEAMIAEHMALLLETIASAAGTPGQREQILQIGGPAFQSTNLVSED